MKNIFDTIHFKLYCYTTFCEFINYQGVIKMFRVKTKSLIILGFSVFLTLFVFSCKTNSVMATTASGTSSINAEPMKIWSRPLELGYTVVGMGEGSYQHNDFEKPLDGGTSFFIGADSSIKLSPGAKMAAFNAIMQSEADGMYITLVKEEHKDISSDSEGLSGSSVKKYWVKGLMLKLVAYDTVSQERSDKARSGTEKNCMHHNHCSKPCHKNSDSASSRKNDIPALNKIENKNQNNTENDE